MIEAQGLTVTYPGGKGVFGLDFQIGDGKTMGYLGPNGAGKTTTIRALLGFMRPDSGRAAIDGLDCFADAPRIQRRLGYIPGEISFPEKMCGCEFLRFMHAVRGGRGKRSAREEELLALFELDPSGRIDKFSKGMKQKLGIVAALMHDPQVLILDEPTSGLDPLMQNRFIALIHRERARGKTILMSSHGFEEVEKTCDQVLIIREGRIIHEDRAETLRRSRTRTYLLQAAQPARAAAVLAEAGFTVPAAENGSFEIPVAGDAVDRFIKAVATLQVVDLNVKSQSLEELFMRFYRQDGEEDAL